MLNVCITSNKHDQSIVLQSKSSTNSGARKCVMFYDYIRVKMYLKIYIWSYFNSAVIIHLHLDNS